MSSGIKISSEISGFDLVKGTEITFKFSQSRVATVVVFLSSECPCSRSHMPVLEQLAQEFKQSGISFVGIHSNTHLENAKIYFKHSNLSFPVIQDSEGKIADDYEALKTPHVFVISPRRQVLFQGGVDNRKVAHEASEHYLRDALAAIREGKMPQKNRALVIGCAIRGG